MKARPSSVYPLCIFQKLLSTSHYQLIYPRPHAIFNDYSFCLALRLFSSRSERESERCAFFSLPHSPEMKYYDVRGGNSSALRRASAPGLPAEGEDFKAAVLLFSRLFSFPAPAKCSGFLTRGFFLCFFFLCPKVCFGCLSLGCRKV